MSIFKSFYVWHRYMKKHEHEFDDYVKNRGWESFYKNNDYSYQKPYGNDDFKMGFNACYEDYHANKRFKHYPLFLIKLGNKVFKHKMRELVEYIEGYLSAKQKIKHEK